MQSFSLFYVVAWGGVVNAQHHIIVFIKNFFLISLTHNVFSLKICVILKYKRQEFFSFLSKKNVFSKISFSKKKTKNFIKIVKITLAIEKKQTKKKYIFNFLNILHGVLKLGEFVKICRNWIFKIIP